MSKVEELIEKFCPDGVEFKTIQDICKNISSGGTPYTARAEYYNGNIPWLRTQEVDWVDIHDTSIKITEEGLKNSSAKLIPLNCVIVAMYGATAAKVAINKIPLCTNQACCNPEINEDVANYKYVFYWLCNEYRDIKALGEGSQSNINGQKVKSYPIPIPPLPIQQEIVNILDKFTQLQAELEAELEARRKQYEYYRNQLLMANDEGLMANDEGLMANGVKANWKMLGEVCEFKYGFTDKANEQGNVRFVRITDINENGKLRVNDSKYLDLTEANKDYLISKGDILMARTGATFGKTMLFNEDYQAVYASFLIRIRFKEKCILPAYYWHFTQSRFYWEQANRLVGGGAQPQFNANVLKTIQIPIPSLVEQERIVKILDKFDKLFNDKSEGIPAEIEARRKQYEYYRGKLLDFKNINNG